MTENLSMDTHATHNSTKRRALAALLLVFCSGIVIGASAAGFYAKHRWSSLLTADRTELRELFRDELQREIEFTDTQLDEVERLASRVWVEIYYQFLLAKPAISESVLEYKRGVESLADRQQQKRFDAYTRTHIGVVAPGYHRLLYRSISIDLEQMLPIDRALAAHAKRIRELPDSVNELARLVIKEAREDIRAVLRPEQQQAFDRMYREVVASDGQ